ncbi:CBL-interacting serine/threonine-protein kinase, putative [Phytophthora infestans T30-4]|uniref:non-specific serine/threonine protein kinase n=2 Tax=Phytophthora infestans TaxID=4787 RepID=D0MTC8_PHYIT|nr:CBL-interacting serine/threonine-protein kinase, putative [Phytophthora infestans T30-4]EEY61225.1 CBL-interacting serine/threonine-protein kinase, putative [Phytophthora infestans T30-4]KAF4031280.1 Protein kinase domain [Phytophthora infestans]|eukprot:XP_002908142.1 CBL-interacting serine/threonine-protein kinase, putative [Phytophthora infestans T30-4]
MTSVLFSAAPVASMDTAQYPEQQRQQSANANTSSQQQPRMLAQYQVLHTLGSGLQGKVKLGVDTATHQRVALKIVDMAKLNRKSMINVYREVEAMSRVSHTNVLRLLSVHDDASYPKKDGKSKQVIVIVLELATGGELFDFMMYTGCFAENIARAYFQQLVAGLEACHAQGVYHRDIKPENLLLDENFALKIADFGLSGLREGADGAVAELYTQCGTRGYMSPEVLSCLSYEGEPADVWSAGVVLFIMLAGFPPFQIATNQDWWFRACAAKQHEAFWAAHARSATFSPGAMSLMTRIFHVKPQERVTLAEIKTHPWFKERAVAPEDLRAELMSRKLQVDEEKRKEREEKLLAASKQRLQKQDEEFDPFNMDVERSMVVPTTTESATAEVSSKKAPSYPSTSVALYTSFQSSRTAPELQTRVEKALAEHSARFVAHKDRFKTKATMAADVGDVGFAVRIYSLDNVPGLCVVEFRRTSGECLKFHEAYKKLSSSLSDLVFDNNDESETADDSPAEELISDEAMMI